jgi:hypothetical protein
VQRHTRQWTTVLLWNLQEQVSAVPLVVPLAYLLLADLQANMHQPLSLEQKKQALIELMLY